ncbi:MAG: excinuclease ABC subunit UvrA [Bacteriovoracaceae bacterium]
MKNDVIHVHKAKVHNLKEVTVSIPKNSLTVITGPSGSGKSSLAFDTIYVEGQRRYIESLSSYARQFLTQYQPPDVEHISGLSPAIAIDQKTSSRNPRSTVGTVTEIFDYMRVLFARIGTLHCPDTGEVVRRYSPSEILKEIFKSKENSKVYLCAPFTFKDKKELKSKLSGFSAQGYVRVLVNGEVERIEELDPKNLNLSDKVSIVVDRLVLKKQNKKRMIDSIELALRLGDSSIHILIDDQDYLFSEKLLSPQTGRVFPDLEPRLFSFNSPLGACEKCNGLGHVKTFSIDLMLNDSNLSLKDGALSILLRNNFLYKMVESVAKAEKVKMTTPYKDLKKEFVDILLYGSNKTYTYSFDSENSHFEFSKVFPGIIAWLEKKYRETSSERTRKSLEEYINTSVCPSCRGLRLNEVALSTLIQKKNIIELTEYPIDTLFDFFKKLKLTKHQNLIAEKLLKEIKSRLEFLLNVGLNYLTLSRPSNTLSGGESQRIRLATQIGSSLSGVLYVLDEPSIGLHQRDNTRLIETLEALRDIGNTVIVVEHDEETIRAADHIIDIGPGAGIHGGKITESLPQKDFLKSKKSLTAKYLNQSLTIDTPSERRELTKEIILKGAKQNNLKSLDVKFPLEGLLCITGVSGSGKSTLIHEVLVPAIKYNLTRTNRILYKRNNYQGIAGIDNIKQIIELDQSPIGRTPKSNPATYTGLFDEIRTLFSKTQEAQIRGYKAGRFSFNVKGGRCETCEGNGSIKVEMHFLPDVYVTCHDCNGKRYNPETLSVLYKGKNISEVLNMSIEEANEFFSNHAKIHRATSVLCEVGLGYMKLGQSATTLSGGEAQRLKLCRELSKKTKGHCLYILDEPTTGLHFQDISALLMAITRLIDQGNTVLIIEHNLDVIKMADWIIDLGPEGGDKGGEIIATGTPEDIAKIKKSHTGKYLKGYL